MNETQPLTVTTEVLANLHAPTPASARQQRQGPGGRMLTYVDARYVQQVLDTEVGPENWQNEFIFGSGGKVGCRIGIRVYFGDHFEWVWKGDGAGETDIEGEKGSFSDALKRAAVQWGIARDLYDEKPTTQGQNGVAQGGSAQSPTGNGASQPAPASPQAVSPQPAGDAPESVGSCPVHGTPWRTTKRDGTPAKRAYCSGKQADGSYCDQQGPWMQARAS